MKNPIKSIINILAIIAIFSFITILVFKPVPVEKAAGAGAYNTIIFSMNTETEVVGSTTASQLLLATSSGSRQYVFIGNNSTSSTMYLGMSGGGAAVVNKGVMIPANTTYELRDVNLYQGAIYVITRTNGGAVGSTTVAARQ